MDKKLRYPVGQQSFEVLRNRGCVYIDKTRFVDILLDKGSQYFFLARPRRFGKSLFLSMMKCFFEGKRHLFKGLYADSMDWDWKPRPVLYLDLNKEIYQSGQSLTSLLKANFEDWEAEYDLTPRSDNLSIRFSDIIRGAAEKTGENVIILVDEYDKPIVNNLHDKCQLSHLRDQLTSVYSNFKSSADYIRFVFLTGVSRFAHLSVFSGLNNISDISFLDEYSDICGITGKELDYNLHSGVESLASAYGCSTDDMRLKLKQHYDGYHFSERCPDIFNPFSILNAMENRKLDNYWIKSGIPTLLEKQIRHLDIDLKTLFSTRCSQRLLEGLDLESPNSVSLFYQTGYLTIKSVESGIFTLGLPNEEVKEGFLGYLLSKFVHIEDNDTEFVVRTLATELREGQIESFMQRLQSMFSSIPYEMEMGNERNLHNALFMLLYLLGIYVKTEYHTSAGRIDLFIKTEKFYYIIELKLNKSATEALQQIEDK